MGRFYGKYLLVGPPIPAHWFVRSLFSGNPPHSPHVLGFSVRFPGRTPDDAREWLRAHGYVFSSRKWLRADRKPTRLGYTQRVEHNQKVLKRRRRRNFG